LVGQPHAIGWHELTLQKNGGAIYPSRASMRLLHSVEIKPMETGNAEKDTRD
jgi:hypothetical protein